MSKLTEYLQYYTLPNQNNQIEPWACKALNLLKEHDAKKDAEIARLKLAMGNGKYLTDTQKLELNAEHIALLNVEIKRLKAEHAEALAKQRAGDLEIACKAVCEDCRAGRMLAQLEPDVNPPMGYAFHRNNDRSHIPNTTGPQNEYLHCLAQPIRTAFAKLEEEKTNG